MQIYCYILLQQNCIKKLENIWGQNLTISHTKLEKVERNCILEHSSPSVATNIKMTQGHF